MAVASTQINKQLIVQVSDTTMLSNNTNARYKIVFFKNA
jgi:hypothetical protein